MAPSKQTSQAQAIRNGEVDGGRGTVTNGEGLGEMAWIARPRNYPKLGHIVTDQSSLHRYRTELPNLVLDMDLSVYAFRLYVQLKRVAGDSGKCFYSTRELAEQCKMSMGMISKAKIELVTAKFITIERDGKWERDNIRIVDIWPANFAYFYQETQERNISEWKSDMSPRDAIPAANPLSASLHGEGLSGVKNAQHSEGTTYESPINSLTDSAKEQSQKGEDARNVVSAETPSITSFPSQKVAGQDFTTSNSSAMNATNKSTQRSNEPCSPHEQTDGIACSPHEHPVHNTNAPVHHMNVKEEPLKEEPLKEEPKERMNECESAHEDSFIHSPSVEQIEFDDCLDLLTDPDVGLDMAAAIKLAAKHSFDALERHIFAWLAHRDQGGDYNTTGALLTRIRRKFSAPVLTAEQKGSELYRRFHTSGYNGETRLHRDYEVSKS